MKIELMHVSRPETHKLMRPMLGRVMAFTQMYESDADLNTLFATLTAAYFHENPTLCMWVGLDEDGEVVGHLFATIDSYFGGKFVTIHQCWKDESVKDFTLQNKKDLTEVVKEFGRRHGCTDVRTYAINETVAQILETYGFARDPRVMLKVPIEEIKEN